MVESSLLQLSVIVERYPLTSRDEVIKIPSSDSGPWSTRGHTVMAQYLEIGVAGNDPLLRARGRGSKTL